MPFKKQTKEEKTSLIISTEDDVFDEEESLASAQLLAEQRERDLLNEKLTETMPESRLQARIDLQYKKGFHNKSVGSMAKSKVLDSAKKKIGMQKELKDQLHSVTEFSVSEAHKSGIDDYSMDAMELSPRVLKEFQFENDQDFIKNYKTRYLAIQKGISMTMMATSPQYNLGKDKTRILAMKEIYEELLAEYEERKEMIESPYYAIFTEKDMKAYLGPDGDAKLQREVKDSYLANYIRAYRKLSESRLGKGKNFREYFDFKKTALDTNAAGAEDDADDGASVVARSAGYSALLRDIDVEMRKNGIYRDLRGDTVYEDANVDLILQADAQTAQRNGVVRPPILDSEVQGRIMDLYRAGGDFYAGVVQLKKELRENYVLSRKAFIDLDILVRSGMLIEKGKKNKRDKAVLDAKLEVQKHRPVGHHDDVPEEWEFHQGKNYAKSCWAVSAAHLVTAFLRKTDKNAPEVPQDFVLRNAQGKPLQYNEELKRKVFGDADVPDFTEEMRNIEEFRMDPENKFGNVLSVADKLLEATQGRAAVRAKRFNLTQDLDASRLLFESRMKMMEREFLDSVHQALSVHKSPVSVLMSRHYVTIVGMDGDTLICRDSTARLGPSYEARIPVNMFIISNLNNGVMEMAWLQEITDGSLLDMQDEVRDLKMQYGARSRGTIAPGDSFTREEYSHTQGIDIKQISVGPEMGDNEVQTLIYLPKGLELP